MDIIWDGITALNAYREDMVNTRVRLADAAKSSDWPTVFLILVKHRELVNSCRLGGSPCTHRYIRLHTLEHQLRWQAGLSNWVLGGQFKTRGGSEPLMLQSEWDIGICKKFFLQC